MSWGEKQKKERRLGGGRGKLFEPGGHVSRIWDAHSKACERKRGGGNLWAGSNVGDLDGKKKRGLCHTA